MTMSLPTGAVLATLFLLAACGGSTSPVAVSGTSNVDAGVNAGSDLDSGAGWDLLAEGEVTDRPVAIHVAHDADELATAWDAGGFTDAVPAVDFDGQIAVVGTSTFGSGCQPMFAEVDVRRERLDAVELQFATVEPGQECGADERSYALAVAIDRDLLEPGFTIGWQGRSVPLP